VGCTVVNAAEGLPTANPEILAESAVGGCANHGIAELPRLDAQLSPSNTPLTISASLCGSGCQLCGPSYETL
jgi:hypothetical protein